MRTQIIPAALGFAAAIALGGATASSAPLGNAGLLKGPAASSVEQVDYRSYRHCHRRHGHKWCHGREAGIFLNFGNKHHRRHRDDHNSRDDHNNRDDHNKHDGMKKKY